MLNEIEIKITDRTSANSRDSFFKKKRGAGEKRKTFSLPCF